jgi:pimeloyl-ACP methyl ester carboxylesterase
MDSTIDEKRLFLGKGSKTRPLSSWKQTTIVVASILWVTSYFLPWTTKIEVYDGSIQYAGESMSWSPCGKINDRPLECSTIFVPMDQFADPGEQDLSTKNFSIPLIRLRGKNATQNLLFNPGGPGGSGIAFMFQRGEQLSTIVGDGFHLVLFDPRGINGSQPNGRCYVDGTSRRKLAPRRPAVWDVEKDIASAFAWSQNFGRACVDVMGEHGKYLNTPQTAADMNTILDALGQEYMVYWGFSYGTILGQTYATMFPERSARVIIDGVANQWDWYENMLDAEAFTDSDNVLDGFFAECIKVGEKCALSSLEKTKEGLWNRLLDFSAQLKQQPLSVYMNGTAYGLFDHAQLWQAGLFSALYMPGKWGEVADILTQLFRGNATEAFLAWAWNVRDEEYGSFEAGSLVQTNDGVSGPKYWPRERDAMLDIILPFFNSSMFSIILHDDLFRKQHWRIPRTHDYVPRKGVQTKHPLLILSTTYDPICPLVSAKGASEAFVGSKIVEVKGYGHCSISAPSMCVARHVREFLYEGKLPDSYTKCEVDGGYFEKPKDGTGEAKVYFEDAEERKIHLAQVKLARDMEWPGW